MLERAVDDTDRPIIDNLANVDGAGTKDPTDLDESSGLAAGRSGLFVVE